ncbi:hypothetical protein ACIQZI_23325 [Peribacillus sp. NPDC096379]|uniref:hypothetical protein n=1 Tax=Peribacillus sp. NPDC096379 TaxID=3364393 RepID=UPI0038239984
MLKLRKLVFDSRAKEIADNNMRYLSQEQKNETIYNISIQELKKGNTFEDVFGNETNLDYMIQAIKAIKAIKAEAKYLEKDFAKEVASM